MVQIIHMQPKQSWQNALGQGVGEGLSEGVKINAQKQARREEQAAQFQYETLRDKQKELATIRAEERGKENIFNYAGIIASRHAKPGTKEYEDMRMAIYAGGVADPSSLKQFGEMSPYQMESYTGHFVTNAMDSMKAAGQGEIDNEQNPQGLQGSQGPKGAQGKIQDQTPYEDREAQDDLTASFNQNKAPQTQVAAEQGPQVVLDSRVAKPQVQEQQSQQEPDVQWINGKKYIRGRIADPFQTDDPVEAMKSIDYFHNKENAKLVAKRWKDVQDTKIAQQNAKISERAANVKEGQLELNKEAKNDLFYEKSPFWKQVEADREGVQTERNAIDLAKIAIKRKDSSGILQWAANKNGYEFLKTTAAGLLDVSSKASVSGMGKSFGLKGLNKWIEQRFLSMGQSVGKPDELNESIIANKEFDLDLIDKKISIADKLRKDGISKHDIPQQTYEQLKVYSEGRQKQLVYDLQKIHDQHSSNIELRSEKKVEPGTYLTPDRYMILRKKYGGSKVDFMKKIAELGYTIPGEGIKE